MPKVWLGWIVGILGIPIVAAIVAAIIWDGFRRFLLQLWSRWFEGRIRAFLRSAKRRLTLDIQDIIIKIRERDGTINGFVIDMNTTIPQVRLWFDITNNSRFNLVLDRLLIAVSTVEPTILGFDEGIFERTELPRKRKVEGLCYFSYLSWAQAEQIGKQATYIQNLKQWQVRVTVQVNGFLYSPWIGWIATGRRTIFRHDAFPIEGTPRKQVAPLPPEDQRKVERAAKIKGAISHLAIGLTNFGLANYESADYGTLMSEIAADLATLRMECPDLFFHVDKIAHYLGDVSGPRNPGYVNEKLITPLMFDARRYLE